MTFPCAIKQTLVASRCLTKFQTIDRGFGGPNHFYLVCSLGNGADKYHLSASFTVKEGKIYEL